MLSRLIHDWSDAYATGPHIPEGDRWPAVWEGPARHLRETLAAGGRARLDLRYGEAPRNSLDLFLPETAARGLVVFVHGGFWMKLDKSYWSHLAAGPLAHGYAVAMPSYVLAPEARISDITRQIGAAIDAAAREIAGPLHITGHSAGGHLVTRMNTVTTPLQPDVVARLRKTVSISGLHDLRPLLKTGMNETLRLDLAEARAESVALLEPLDGIDVTCWAGADERPEFLRQNSLLENLWSSFSIEISSVAEAGRHHYDVIEGLADPDHRLVRTLLGV